MKRYKGIKILLIEDEDFDIRRVRKTLSIIDGAFEIVNVVSDGEEALKLIKKDREAYDIVIMDYQIGGGVMGEELIMRMKELSPLLQVIVITKRTINITDFEFANKLLEAGAFWYCTKYPGDIEDFIYQPTDFNISLFNAYEKKALEHTSYMASKKLNNNILETLDRKQIIGSSEYILNQRRQINKLANSEVNVFISGPSGTGKELIANHIHYKSKRKFENFVAINCGSIPHNLIESELFGYEKGAFTGADSKKLGLFEIANNGTIFLDEVADLPLEAQVKLLRVLQEGEIEKLGRTKKVKVNVRIIAATNKKIEQEVLEGRFREDLYYRLNVVPVFVLPLKERKDDIRDLLFYYLEKFSIEMDMQSPDFTNEALQYLMKYEWPGNVRELKNFIQRVLYYSDGEITKDDAATSLLGAITSPSNQFILLNFFNQEGLIPYNEMLKLFKKKYVEFVRKNSKSDADAAKKMGIAPPNFHRLCKELGLK